MGFLIYVINIQLISYYYIEKNKKDRHYTKFSKTAYIKIEFKIIPKFSRKCKNVRNGK